MPAHLSEYRAGENIAGTQYRFVKALGFGGHGSVYAVEHTFLEAPAVMKLLHPELATESDVSERMTREARTLAKLRHPNIVEVRDGGMTAEDPPRPYFVMESLNGMSLRELVRHMKGRGIGVLPALRIMGGVFEGLHHAHSAGVIHRDIKPDNIFLHRTSTDVTIPKILDFGIAHLLIGNGFTGKSFVGTPRYAAPEQLMGERITVGTDIYSAGLVLHELMTGRSPYHDKKDLGPLLEAHMHEKLPAVSSRVLDATPEVDTLLEYLLEKDPARRPPTAFAAAVAVRELRAFIEAQQQRSADHATDPTPIDNLLNAKIELATEEGRPSSRPTRPIAIRTLASEGPISPPPLSPQLTEPLLSVPPPPSSIDRAAPTRTSHDLALLVPAGNDTVPYALESGPHFAAVSRRTPAGEIVPGPPSAASIDFTTATDFADATAGQPPAPPPSLLHRLGARPVLVFCVALILFSGIGVPVAVTIAKRYAPQPPPVVTSTATPTSATVPPSASDPPPPPLPPASVIPSAAPAPSARPPRPPRPHRPKSDCVNPGDPGCVVY